MVSSASRGFFTGASTTITNSSTRVAGATVAAVGGRGGAMAHSGRLTFQELQHTRRTFSTSNMVQRKNNGLARFAGNFSVESSNKVVYTIAAINVAIFGVWQYAEGNAKRFHDGRLYIFMYRNFSNSLQNLKEGRVWTLVTSAFSHKEWYHILLNSMVLLSFGDPVSCCRIIWTC
jgi:membrane associated rhomboid family serine protease